MRKMFDNKDDLVYKIERNQIIPNGYAQKISYRIIKKAWYITFFCQIVVYDILSDIFKQGVNVTICLIEYSTESEPLCPFLRATLSTKRATLHQTGANPLK